MSDGRRISGASRKSSSASIKPSRHGSPNRKASVLTRKYSTIALSKKRNSSRNDLISNLDDEQALHQALGPMEDPTTASTFTLANGVSFESLRELKTRFESFAKQGGLDEDTFVQFFAPGMSKDMSKEDLHLLFMRMDSDASGHITWDELSSSLLTYKAPQSDDFQSEHLSQFVDKDLHCDPDAPGDDDGPAYSDRHEDMVNVIQINKNNYYYTAADDGQVRCWNIADGSLHSIIHRRPPPSAAVPISSMLLFNDYSHLAVASIDRSITVYGASPQGHEVVRKYVGEKLANPTKGETLTLSNSRGKAQARGHRTTSSKNHPSMNPCKLRDLVDPPSALGFMQYASRNHLIVGVYSGALQIYDISRLTLSSHPTETFAEKKINVHSDVISRIIPCDILSGVITSSWDRKIAITDPEHGSVVRVLGQNEGHVKSVLSMDWCDSFKVIASSGCERDLYIWNPYILHPVSKFTGHNAPVVNIVFNEEDMQLCSLDKDKNFKIWDLRGNKLFQTFRDHHHYYPEDCLSAMAFDPFRRCLVAASTYIQTWHMTTSEEKMGGALTTALERPCPALQNRKYGHIITFSSNIIHVWSVISGKRIMSFNLYPDMDSGIRDEGPNTGTIATTEFDTVGRRLIVSFTNGNMLMCNYMNGEVTKRFATVFTEEATNMIHILRDEQELRCIYASVGDKLVMWPDGQPFYQKQEREMTVPSGSVTALSFIAPVYLAICSSNGFIILHDVINCEDVYKLTPRMPIRKLTSISKSTQDSRTDSREGANSAPKDDIDDEDKHILSVIGHSKQATKVPEALAVLIHKEVLAVTMGDKFIHMWVTSNPIRMLPPFDASIYKNQHLYCIATDGQNRYLLSADDEGYIYCWDIQNMPASPERMKKSMFELVSSFKAHNRSVMMVMFIDSSELILSTDTTGVHNLHNKQGACLGSFGASDHPSEVKWDLTDKTTWQRPAKWEDERIRELHDMTNDMDDELSSPAGPSNKRKLSKGRVGVRIMEVKDDAEKMPETSSADHLPKIVVKNLPKSSSPLEHSDSFHLPTLSARKPPRVSLCSTAPASVEVLARSRSPVCHERTTSPSNRTRKKLDTSQGSAYDADDEHSILKRTGEGQAHVRILSPMSDKRDKKKSVRRSPGKPPHSPCTSPGLNQSSADPTLETSSAPKMDIMEAIGGVHARKGPKSQWLNRIMNRWMAKDHSQNSPLFDVVKATLGVTLATTLAFGSKGQDDDDDDKLGEEGPTQDGRPSALNRDALGLDGIDVEIQVTDSQHSLEQPQPGVLRDNARAEAQSGSEDSDDILTRLASLQSVSETSPTVSPSKKPGQQHGYISKAVNEAKAADKQWVDRAISLLPLQSIESPLRLHTKQWHHPDTDIINPKEEKQQETLPTDEPITPVAQASNVGFPKSGKKYQARKRVR